MLFYLNFFRNKIEKIYELFIILYKKSTILQENTKKCLKKLKNEPRFLSQSSTTLNILFTIVEFSTPK